MAEEEKVEIVPEEKPAEDRFDDDFVDDKAAEAQAAKEAAAAAEAAQKAAQEEQEKKEEIDLHYVEEDEGAVAVDNAQPAEKPAEPQAVRPEPGPEGPYDDERLQKIEDARIGLQKTVKKWAVWKVVVVLVLFADIFCAWLLPRNLLGDDQQVAKVVIGISCTVVGLVGYFLFQFFNKKAEKKALRAFVKVFYEMQNDYVFEDTGASNFVGDVDSKVSKEEFAEMDIYPNVSQIGSRSNMTFTYNGMDCAIADLAAQKDNGKYLQTIFVGKYLRTHNTATVSEEGIAIYFKGGDRAIPPEGIKNRPIIENNKRYIIVGSNADKHLLSPKFRAAMKEIRTDKLLVDVAILIKPGKTYWGLGYEDTLMILPETSRFNPAYTQKFKGQLKQILDLAAMLNE